MVHRKSKLVATIKKMKWMIVGAKGQLGTAMSHALSRERLDYVSLNRADLDIVREKEVSMVFSRERPDIIVNAAAWTNVDLAESNESLAYDVNVYGASLLAQECENIGSKLIHISTDYVFSGAVEETWKESAPPNPTSIYGKTKWKGEEAVLAAHKNGTYVVRTAWLFSQWGDNFVKKMMRIASQSSDEVHVISDQIGQPTSADDLALQLIKMVQQDVNPGIYHGTNSGESSWYEFAQCIFKSIGADPERVVPKISIPVEGTADRPKYSVLSHAGWGTAGMNPMRDWREALHESAPSILSAVKHGM